MTLRAKRHSARKNVIQQSDDALVLPPCNHTRALCHSMETHPQRRPQSIPFSLPFSLQSSLPPRVLSADFISQARLVVAAVIRSAIRSHYWRACKWPAPLGIYTVNLLFIFQSPRQHTVPASDSSK
jgi:hypothetical protein